MADDIDFREMTSDDGGGGLLDDRRRVRRDVRLVEVKEHLEGALWLWRWGRCGCGGGNGDGRCCSNRPDRRRRSEIVADGDEQGIVEQIALGEVRPLHELDFRIRQQTVIDVEFGAVGKRRLEAEDALEGESLLADETGYRATRVEATGMDRTEANTGARMRRHQAKQRIHVEIIDAIQQKADDVQIPALLDMVELVDTVAGISGFELTAKAIAKRPAQ